MSKKIKTRENGLLGRYPASPGNKINTQELCYRYITIDNVIPHNIHKKFEKETDLILADSRTWSTYLPSNDNHSTKQQVPIPIKIVKCNETGETCSHTRLTIDGEIRKGPHMFISLVSDDYVETTACPSLEAKRSHNNNDRVKLSCTSISGDKPYNVYINIDNWNAGFRKFLQYDGYSEESHEFFSELKQYYGYDVGLTRPGPNGNRNTKSMNTKIYKENFPIYSTDTVLDESLLARYHEYVINHEVGHAMGRGHYVPRNINSPEINKSFPAPIMMQQTKGLNGHSFNTWPLKEEDFRNDETHSEDNVDMQKLLNEYRNTL